MNDRLALSCLDGSRDRATGRRDPPGRAGVVKTAHVFAAFCCAADRHPAGGRRTCQPGDILPPIASARSAANLPKRPAPGWGGEAQDEDRLRLNPRRRRALACGCRSWSDPWRRLSPARLPPPPIMATARKAGRGRRHDQLPRRRPRLRPSRASADSTIPPALWPARPDRCPALVRDTTHVLRDPGNVTIFGESAGGGSVMLLTSRRPRGACSTRRSRKAAPRCRRSRAAMSGPTRQ